MLVLIRNEIVKLLLRKKTLVVTLAFIALIGVVAYGLSREAKNLAKYETVEYQIENLQRSIELTKNSKDRIPPDIKGDERKVEEYRQNLDRQVEGMEKRLVELKALEGKSLDWREELKLSIRNLEGQIKDNAFVSERIRDEWKFELEKLRYLQENDIKPIKGYEFNAFNFMNKLAMILGTIFLAVGVAVFVSDMVSGECTPPTMKLLLTQPVSRGKVLLSKFIAVTVTSTLIIVIVELLFFLGIGFTSGFGSPDYPMMVGSMFEYDMTSVLENGTHPLKMIAGSAHVITAAQYLIRLFLMQILFIVACTSFGFLLSTVLKSSMVSMAVSIVSIIAAIVMTQAIPALRKMAVYLFVTYGDVGSILDGRMALSLQNPVLTTPAILMILSAWTIICYVVSHVVFTKKDILI